MNANNSNNNINANGCHQNNHHSSIKLMLHMILCCGLPIVIIMTLPYIARISPAVATFLGVIAPFLCPIMMGGMMYMMFKGNKKSKETSTHKEIIASEKESRSF